MKWKVWWVPETNLWNYGPDKDLIIGTERNLSGAIRKASVFVKDLKHGKLDYTVKWALQILRGK